jgi:hypothetical protein
MRRKSSSLKPLSLLAGLTLMAATAVVTAPARAAEMQNGAAGSGATFINSSNHHVTVYTRFGGGGDCDAQPKDQKVDLDAKQTVNVDSGGSDVCMCTRVPDKNLCPSGWIKVKAGGTKHLA